MGLSLVALYLQNTCVRINQLLLAAEDSQWCKYHLKPKGQMLRDCTLSRWHH